MGEQWRVYLNFSADFNSFSFKTITEKLLKLDEQTVRRTEQKLNVQAQRVVISGTNPSWKTIASGVSQGSSPL